jgi:hypothetical protein
MIAFNGAHRKLHVSDDRRVVVILLRRYTISLMVAIAVPILLASM